MDIKWKKGAKKYVEKQDAITKQRFVNAIEFLEKFPFENHLDIEPIEGKTYWYRMRVGKYRILFSVDVVHRMVVIEEVDSRGGVYKRH